MSPISDIRPSPIAGLWYSGNSKRLAQQVDDFMDRAAVTEIPGDVIGVISPHAGYRYSGSTAGYAYRCVRGRQVDVVAVISPLHSFFPGPLLTSGHKAYATPLGEIPIDRELLIALEHELKKDSNLSLSAVVDDEEHSLEIELPFLQRALHGDFRLLPVMVRSQSPVVAQKLGKALAVVLKSKRALLVASTDLSHFYPEQTANALDSEMLGQIASFSPEGVLAAEEKGTGYACGVAAVAAVLWAARDLGANSIEILHHSTSAEETGDHSSVVGYGAAVIVKKT